MDENSGEAADARTNEIDLRARLRSAAGSLAADFGDEVTVDVAEELVFSSAQGLLALASVTDFVPIFAERRARRAVRSGAAVPASAAAPAAAASPPPPVAAPSAPVPASVPPPASPGAGVAPLLAVPGDTLTRLRDEVERARLRLAGWRADLTRR